MVPHANFLIFVWKTAFRGYKRVTKLFVTPFVTPTVLHEFGLFFCNSPFWHPLAISLYWFWTDLGSNLLRFSLLAVRARKFLYFLHGNHWPATQWRTSLNPTLCSLLTFHARAQVSYPLLGNHWIGQQHNGAEA